MRPNCHILYDDAKLQLDQSALNCKQLLHSYECYCEAVHRKLVALGIPGLVFGPGGLEIVWEASGARETIQNGFPDPGGFPDPKNRLCQCTAHSSNLTEFRHVGASGNDLARHFDLAN